MNKKSVKHQKLNVNVDESLKCASVYSSGYSYCWKTVPQYFKPSRTGLQNPLLRKLTLLYSGKKSSENIKNIMFPKKLI